MTIGELDADGEASGVDVDAALLLEAFLRSFLVLLGQGPDQADGIQRHDFGDAFMGSELQLLVLMILSFVWL
jgi:hypothetical protein